MGSLSDKLIYLNNTKTLLKNRLNSLGANITENTTLRNYQDWLDKLFKVASNKMPVSILVGNTTVEENILVDVTGEQNCVIDSQNFPIDLGNIKLSSVNNVKDNLKYKNNKFYIEENIGKINSYNGETITTDYISSTGGLDTGAQIRYILDTSIETEITKVNYSILYTQLNNILNYEVQKEIREKLF